MRQAVIAEKLSEKFGVTVSATWASRLIKNYGIPQKNPRPPGIKKVRVPMAPGEQSDGSLVQQYPLPSPGQYPSFREGLHQALTAGQPNPPLLYSIAGIKLRSLLLLLVPILLDLTAGIKL
jgi:peptidoglycan hydrolase-like protein with peptidoglycan-binding domain